MGMYVFFPSFILEVDTAVDFHLSYKPLVHLASLSPLDYVQPVTPQHSASKTTTLPSALSHIKPDDNVSIALTFAAHWPKKLPSSPPPLDINLSLISTSKYFVNLKDMSREELIHHLYAMDLKLDQTNQEGMTISPAADGTTHDRKQSKLECISLFQISITLLPHPHLFVLAIGLMRWR
jgi:hypothetical protein